MQVVKFEMLFLFFFILILNVLHPFHSFIKLGEYKFLMHYQDHGTKFSYLRPLKSKEAREVAEELSKIFYMCGAPRILQSDNGKEFVAKVINEVVAVRPYCKILHGRPRHPETQGSVKRANGDVKNMIKAWVVGHNSTNWSKGCYDVQVKKNYL